MKPWHVKRKPTDQMRTTIFHIERWIAETVTYTAAEEAAYLRLKLWCLHNESDLPSDLAECFRIARAVGKAEKEAVKTILARRFAPSTSGFFNEEIKKEIIRWQAVEPSIEAKKELTRVRVDRWRKKRQQAARMANAEGKPLEGNETHDDLEERFPELVENGPASVDNHGEVTRYVTRTEHVSNGVSNANGYALAVSASGNAFVPSELTQSAREGGGAGTAAGSACRAMRRVGLVGVNPAHPQLLALLAAGATEDHFAAVAASAVARDKGFGWVLAVVEGQLRDGAKTTAALADRKHAEAATLAERIAPELFAPK